MLPLLLLSALTTSYAAPVAEPLTDLVRRASGTNYNQNYIAGGANVQYTPNQSAGSYSVTWNTNADFVVGLGWQTGDATPITYSGSFKVNSGTPGGLLSVYGWTTNPLVEYYVVENQGNGYNTGGTKKGTLTSDGATYDVWQHQQTNQPSIQGTSTFQQYISIRQTPRSSGTVTLQNHFNAWSGFGMKLGTYNFQVMAVESWSGGGSAQISLSKGAASGGSGGSGSAPSSSAAPTATAKPTSAAPTSAAPTSAPTGGSGVAPKYGQCGGQGWTGPTTCAAGSTCKASNQWYSQCL